MKLISVVQDALMYQRLVKENIYNRGVECFPFDNSQENKFVSIRYNEFLDGYDYNKPDWLVFCHEDWEIKEDWQAKIEALDKNFLYGPIGMAYSSCLGFGVTTLWGKIINSDKDGSNATYNGCDAEGVKQVSTLDCQCLIVHSDLIKKYDLRFDENLSFDLYVEDFCINAKENHDIDTKVVQLHCQHFSFGTVAPRYHEQFAYLQDKYKNAQNGYMNTVSFKKQIGKQTFCVVIKNSLRLKAITPFYRVRITDDRKRVIKLFGIPCYSKKLSVEEQAKYFCDVE